ncbi:WhiB family transcriptional regulator [Streptomyces sp. NPDC048338]|uniref:WhiB family transcriptional regulator n=1 Tax=Streptomyces sp. NPDC048338 TaxID=3365536 RepID=UPI003713ADF7
MTPTTPAPGMTAPLPGAGTNWKADGLCRQVDPTIFFPEAGDGATALQAKTVCLACEVRLTRLEYAIEHGETGIWGGTTRDQRKAIRRARDVIRVRGAQNGEAA